MRGFAGSSGLSLTAKGLEASRKPFSYAKFDVPDSPKQPAQTHNLVAIRNQTQIQS